jgi:hypothetical protein
MEAVAEQMPDALVQLEQVILRGRHGDDCYQQTWQQITEVIKKGRLRKEECRRLAEMKQTIPKEQALALMSVVVEAVRSNVKDRETLQAIQKSLSAVLAVPNDESPI